VGVACQVGHALMIASNQLSVRTCLLQANLADGVLRLRLREPGAVAGGQLLDQPGSTESLPQSQVALRGQYGLTDN
jgi:hypothetical protein